ncbi:hypothetical protein SDC9_61110 [bioreactor metagenome]|uniref:Uncharacterized protein n=1 Tax=bioreactor metagenome TaxID=1076179 RepID=A0A644XEU4_9ZZZZ
MSSENKQDKQAAMSAIAKINAVEGFDPTPLAVEYSDLNGGESRLRLPVMAQLAWFRLKYPEGRIAITVASGKECFVATARIYHHFSDQPEQFLSEATASRGPLPDKPSVSPREWAQTAAVGIALRNAGFGLQFGAAGDSFDSPAVDELGGIIWSNDPSTEPPISEPEQPTPVAPIAPPAPQETPLELAMRQLCPIAKYKDKTLGELVQLDPKALVWVANKFTGDAVLSDAAKLICEQALQETA